MIRIDEIYQNTFWPWLKTKHLGVRMQFCDPFGRSDPDSILNYGTEVAPEYNYTFFFDQEPIHLNLHLPTFDRIRDHHNPDLHAQHGPNIGWLITSECDSDNVRYICERYNWKSAYYFFHGWAALDWFRGYDKTFLITPPEERNITKTFIAPNRIIAGQRQHRLLMLYHIFKNNLTNNWISCPQICPAENISAIDATKNLTSLYSDIQDVFRNQPLPIEFPNETGHPMHSCWLSLFEESADSLLYLVTETIADGRRHHLTEKTFKPICMAMPFVLVSTVGSLNYLKKYGFKTFDSIWDESYDEEPDDLIRIEKIAKLLKDLDSLSLNEKRSLFKQALPIVNHNFNHFYYGGFEKVLWKELTDMLEMLDVQLCI